MLGGVSLRSYQSNANKVLTVAVPVVAVEGIGHFTLGKTGALSHFAVEPLARFQYDLRAVQIQVNGGPPTTLPPWELRFGVGFAYQ